VTDWIPPVSVLTEERDAILQLIRLCRRYQARRKAKATSLELLAPRNLRFAQEVLALEQALLVSSEREAEIEYREVESALCRGTDFLPALQELLARHQSAS